MTTSRIGASAWPQNAGIAPSEPRAAKNSSSWAVALIGVGVVLNVGWIGLLAFVAAKLTFL